MAPAHEDPLTILAELARLNADIAEHLDAIEALLGEGKADAVAHPNR